MDPHSGWQIHFLNLQDPDQILGRESAILRGLLEDTQILILWYPYIAFGHEVPLSFVSSADSESINL